VLLLRANWSCPHKAKRLRRERTKDQGKEAECPPLNPALLAITSSTVQETLLIRLCPDQLGAAAQKNIAEAQSNQANDLHA